MRQDAGKAIGGLRQPAGIDQDRPQIDVRMNVLPVELQRFAEAGDRLLGLP